MVYDSIEVERGSEGIIIKKVIYDHNEDLVSEGDSDIKPLTSMRDFDYLKDMRGSFQHKMKINLEV